MEERVPALLHTELSGQKSRIIRSDASLYFLLLLFVIGCILLSRWLSDRFGVMRLFFQIGLYFILLGLGYLFYRFRLVSFRYTLTTEELLIYHCTGSKQKLLYAVPIDSIAKVGVWEEGKGRYDGRTFVGKRSDAVCIYYETDSGLHALCVSASERLKELLAERQYGQGKTVTTD
jgi:hypothetical protein